ncbi:hypothetical protein [Polyangium sp. 6x1]|uniref:hypothetical protein n=1 Tax=Polyangium sp. 6x1 TaxID=3042689 RepID=UPI0024826982|nr:hypothetical protein [Polyangium sp. 6x1]MDI1444577.1 hypothetical protein [Polyangium sp. 6x1]
MRAMVVSLVVARRKVTNSVPDLSRTKQEAEVGLTEAEVGMLGTRARFVDGAVGRREPAVGVRRCEGGAPGPVGGVCGHEGVRMEPAVGMVGAEVEVCASRGGLRHPDGAVREAEVGVIEAEVVVAEGDGGVGVWGSTTLTIASKVSSTSGLRHSGPCTRSPIILKEIWSSSGSDRSTFVSHLSNIGKATRALLLIPITGFTLGIAAP